MRYTMASKWSKERFTIDDDEGKPQFEVLRIYGLDGNSLSLRDLGDNELAAIRPRTGPTRFEITVRSQPLITVRHKGWFGKKYFIDMPTGEMSTKVGDFSRKSYDLYRLRDSDSDRVAAINSAAESRDRFRRWRGRGITNCSYPSGRDPPR